ncbi:MAG: GNAT family N-acetyltransferase [Provencibacterium sp.]|jgi:RimJ/RimL family protein N-acetyltransferase|nr:GNAT family N-acetyltransferase [Provencibacterium sp.]
MKIADRWEREGFLLRPARAEDAESYYLQNYCPLDKEVARLTGCQEQFTREQVVSFFLNALQEEDRAFFLLLSPDGRIIGESVINEIDWRLRRANFRIAIYQTASRGKGLGSWMVEKTRDFAFEKLRLHRLELDVFSFNPRAEKAYLKAGFKREGVLRDALLDGDTYADDILMAILEEDWRAIRGLQGK